MLAASENASATTALYEAMNTLHLVLVCDDTGRIRSANAQARALGMTSGELEGQPLSSVMPSKSELSGSTGKAWQQAVNGSAATAVTELKGKQSPVAAQCSFCPSRDSGGHKTIIVIAMLNTENSSNRLLDEAGKVMQSLSTGNLTTTMQGRYQGTEKQFADTINNTISQLSSHLQKVFNDADKMHSIVEQLNKTTHDALNSASHAASENQEAAAAAMQISGSIKDVANSLDGMVNNVSDVSTHSLDAVDIAQKAVVLAHDAKENVNQLVDSSSAIGAVIKVINTIADQTNLLALNATIEAARAGEAGKGFAVVANEVKELAKETARATEEVSAKIAAIQSDSEVAVNAINDIGETIESINNTQSAISGKVNEQSSASRLISQSVGEVSKGSEAIEAALERASKVADENRDYVASARSTTTDIKTLTDNMRQTVSGFRLGHG